MLPIKSLLFLAGAVAAAENSIVLFNPYNVISNASTVTLKGSDSRATTYQVVDCASSLSQSSAPLPASTGSLTSATRTASPSVMTHTSTHILSVRPRADSGAECTTHTVIEGPGTYEFRVTVKDIYTINANCNWKGAISSAEATCTASGDGPMYTGTEAKTLTTTANQAMIQSKSFIQTYAVVSGAPSSSRSTGLAPKIASPTGVAAVVGGAAGILAAAMAL